MMMMGMVSMKTGNTGTALVIMLSMMKGRRMWRRGVLSRVLFRRIGIMAGLGKRMSTILVGPNKIDRSSWIIDQQTLVLLPIRIEFSTDASEEFLEFFPLEFGDLNPIQPFQL
jgi:hypothetical protein